LYLPFNMEAISSSTQKMFSLYVIFVGLVIGLVTAADYTPVYMDTTTRLSISKTKVARIQYSASGHYPPRADDILSVSASSLHMIIVAPRKIDIDGVMPDCYTSRLTVLDPHTQEQMDVWCNTTLPDNFPKTSESYLKLLFQGGPNEVNNTGFDIIVTQTHTSTCTDQEYMCAKDFYCIDKRFKCDGFVNCPDKSDEDVHYGCAVSTTAVSTTVNATNATSTSASISPITTRITTMKPTSKNPTSSKVTATVPMSTTPSSSSQNGFSLLFLLCSLIGCIVVQNL